MTEKWPKRGGMTTRNGGVDDNNSDHDKGQHWSQKVSRGDGKLSGQSPRRREVTDVGKWLEGRRRHGKSVNKTLVPTTNVATPALLVGPSR